MKEKQSKCSVDIFLTMILLSWIRSLLLHWFRDIYRRYFLRNIPIISLTDYKEKIEIYTKYLEKKSNLVGGKYLSLHRWVSQVWIVHFASWICDFTTWRWFLNLEMICHLFRSLKVISQRGSQLRKWSFNLRSGTCVLAGGFVAVKHLAKFRKWISFRSSFRNCEIFAQLDAVVFKQP